MPPPTRVAAATRRSAVLWVSSPTVAPTLVWHVWHDAAAYVVCAGREQALPPLGPCATVAVRSRAGALVVTWEAAVTRVEPGTPPWETVVPLLAAERLNAPAVQALPALWAADSAVLRLDPLQVGAAGDGQARTTSRSAPVVTS